MFINVWKESRDEMLNLSLEYTKSKKYQSKAHIILSASGPTLSRTREDILKGSQRWHKNPQRTW